MNQVCECFYSWTGNDCGTPTSVPECVNGEAIAPDLCKCEEGWGGRICDYPLCQSWPEPSADCGHGQCVSPYNCQCEPGWEQYRPINETGYDVMEYWSKGQDITDIWVADDSNYTFVKGDTRFRRRYAGDGTETKKAFCTDDLKRYMFAFAHNQLVPTVEDSVTRKLTAAVWENDFPSDGTGGYFPKRDCFDPYWIDSSDPRMHDPLKGPKMNFPMKTSDPRGAGWTLTLRLRITGPVTNTTTLVSIGGNVESNSDGCTTGAGGALMVALTNDYPNHILIGQHWKAGADTLYSKGKQGNVNCVIVCGDWCDATMCLKEEYRVKSMTPLEQNVDWTVDFVFTPGSESNHKGLIEVRLSRDGQPPIVEAQQDIEFSADIFSQPGDTSIYGDSRFLTDECHQHGDSTSVDETLLTHFKCERFTDEPYRNDPRPQKRYLPNKFDGHLYSVHLMEGDVPTCAECYPTVELEEKSQDILVYPPSEFDKGRPPPAVIWPPFGLQGKEPLSFTIAITIENPGVKITDSEIVAFFGGDEEGKGGLVAYLTSTYRVGFAIHPRNLAFIQGACTVTSLENGGTKTECCSKVSCTPALYKIQSQFSMIAPGAPYRVEVTYSREAKMCQLFVDAVFEVATPCDFGNLVDANEYSLHNSMNSAIEIEALRKSVTEMYIVKGHHPRCGYAEDGPQLLFYASENAPQCTVPTCNYVHDAYCISCNSTECHDCEAGFYLDSDKRCKQCHLKHEGSNLCNFDRPLSCDPLFVMHDGLCVSFGVIEFTSPVFHVFPEEGFVNIGVSLMLDTRLNFEGAIKDQFPFVLQLETADGTAKHWPKDGTLANYESIKTYIEFPELPAGSKKRDQVVTVPIKIFADGRYHPDELYFQVRLVLGHQYVVGTPRPIDPADIVSSRAREGFLHETYVYIWDRITAHPGNTYAISAGVNDTGLDRNHPEVIFAPRELLIQSMTGLNTTSEASEDIFTVVVRPDGAAYSHRLGQATRAQKTDDDKSLHLGEFRPNVAGTYTVFVDLAVPGVRADIIKAKAVPDANLYNPDIRRNDHSVDFFWPEVQLAPAQVTWTGVMHFDCLPTAITPNKLALMVSPNVTATLYFADMGKIIEVNTSVEAPMPDYDHFLQFGNKDCDDLTAGVYCWDRPSNWPKTSVYNYRVEFTSPRPGFKEMPVRIALLWWARDIDPKTGITKWAWWPVRRDCTKARVPIMGSPFSGMIALPGTASPVESRVSPLTVAPFHTDTKPGDPVEIKVGETVYVCIKLFDKDQQSISEPDYLSLVQVKLKSPGTDYEKLIGRDGINEFVDSDDCYRAYINVHHIPPGATVTEGVYVFHVHVYLIMGAGDEQTLEDISDSPVVVHAQAAFSAAQFSDIIPKSAPDFSNQKVSVPETFLIQSRDQNNNKRTEGGDSYKVIFVGPKHAPKPVAARLTGTVTDLADGTYRVDYDIKVSGVYDMEITLLDELIWSSPVENVTFYDELDPDFTACSGPGVTLRAILPSQQVISGVKTHFHLRARDYYNVDYFTGGAGIYITLSKEGTYSITDYNNGLYLIEYEVCDSGLVKVEVEIVTRGERKAVKGSPFDVDVLPGAPEHAVVSMIPARRMGNALKIQADVFDRCGNFLNAPVIPTRRNPSDPITVPDPLVSFDLKLAQDRFGNAFETPIPAEDVVFHYDYRDVPTNWGMPAGQPTLFTHAIELKPDRSGYYHLGVTITGGYTENQNVTGDFGLLLVEQSSLILYPQDWGTTQNPTWHFDQGLFGGAPNSDAELPLVTVPMRTFAYVTILIRDNAGDPFKFTNDTFNVAFWQDDECPSASFCARFPPPWAPIVGCQVSLDASRSVPICDKAVDSSVPVNLIWGQEHSISNADAENGVRTVLEAARANDQLALHPHAVATEPQADPETGFVPDVAWNDQWPQSTLLYSIDTQRVSNLRGSATVMSRGSYVCSFFQDPGLSDKIII